MGLMFPIYFLSSVLSAGLTLASTYQILELSDLDCEYSSPVKSCSVLNSLVIPELLLIGIQLTLHVITLNWIPVAITGPVVAWHIYLYKSTSKGQTNSYDPTTITEEKVLNKHVRNSLFKLIFHLFHFLSYMYLAVITIGLT